MATKTTSNKRAAKGARKPRKASAGARGNMKPGEIQALAITARQAFDFQMELGTLDADTSFDAWRRDQVMEVVGKSGLSKLDHGDFLPVRAHFALLAGKDENALNDLMRTGKVKDHGAPDDTHENRRQLVHLIREKIGFHVIFGETPEAQVSPKEKGPIREGYAIYVAKMKFKIHPRSIDELSDRLTVAQLNQLLFTIVNRIASKEGRPEVTGRNKKQERESREAKVARAFGEVGPTPRHP